MVEIETGRRRSSVVIAVRGDLDYAAAVQLRGAIAGVTESELLVDLSGVPFMDSSGLAALLVAQAERERRGLALRVCAVSPQVERLLRVTGAEVLLPAPGGDE